MNVLFIGNSHTYINSMPRILLALVEAENRGFELSVDQSTGRGVSLEWHLNHPATREMIKSRRWDYVVLQDRSGGPLEELELFQWHAGLLDMEIRKQGAEGKTLVDLDEEQTLFLQKKAFESDTI